MRLVLVADQQSYNLEPFERAAAALGAEVVVATDRCGVLAKRWAGALGDRVVALSLRRPAEAVRRIVELAEHRPVAAVLSLSDKTAEVAAQAAAALGLPHNPPSAARAARSKIALREALARGSVAQPAFRVLDAGDRPERAAREVCYPCVLKPALLSGSRGVIRADDPDAFCAAFRRVAATLSAEAPLSGDDPHAQQILVEEYVPGVEVALECLLEAGELRPLAIFDKPDPLVGPFFEETLYVTPSRLPEAAQARIVDLARQAARALGLMDGPVHAELRLEGDRAWVIEMAARTIGGLCSRTLRFGTGMGLEELVVRHALGLPASAIKREERAAGAMMLPIPRAGILHEVHGIDEARALPLVEEVEISIRPGEEVVPLPEGHRYLGFVFARGPSPDAVEEALRAAHAVLSFDIRARVALG
jgi:biotin carboxylase